MNMGAFTYKPDSLQEENLTEVPLPGIAVNSVVQSHPQPVLEASQEKDSSVQLLQMQAQEKNIDLNQKDNLLIDSITTLPTQNTFELHSGKAENSAFILPNNVRNNSDSDWLTLIIFIGIILFASIRYSYTKYIKHLFLSLFNYSTSVRMLNDKNYPVFHAAYRLEVIFYLVLSIFIYQGMNLLKWENTKINPTYFAIIFGGVLIYFLSKKLIYLMLGLLFETQNETREYLFNYDNFNRSLGLIFLPVVILIQFAPLITPVIAAISGLIILLIFNLILLSRGAIILLKKQFSLSYLFLYLCSLEILPLLLIYKVVV